MISNNTTGNGIVKTLAENFRQTIFNQHNLLVLAKKAIIDEEYATVEALTISIDHFNDDLFQLFERLDKLAESEFQVP